jgi:hypothetical protein
LFGGGSVISASSGEKMRAKLEFLRDMAGELAVMSAADDLAVLVYLFRMAEAEAGRLRLQPFVGCAGQQKAATIRTVIRGDR